MVLQPHFYLQFESTKFTCSLVTSKVPGQTPTCLLPYMESMVTLERDSLANQKLTVISLKEET